MISYFCEILGVSRSGYYRYISTEDVRNKRESKDLEIRNIILKAFNKRGYKKGSRSIKMLLEQEENIIFNRKRIQRIMRKFNIIIDPFEYLTYIFKNTPQLDLTKEENIEKLLPEVFKDEKKKDS